MPPMSTVPSPELRELFHAPVWRLPLSVNHNELLAEVRAIPAEYWDTEKKSRTQAAARRVFLKGYPHSDPPVDGDRHAVRAALDNCPRIRHFIFHQLPGDVQNCLVAALGAQQLIPPHQDYDPRQPGERRVYYTSSVRFHFPLLTSPDAIFGSGFRVYHLQMGSAYGIDNGGVHWVYNGSQDQERIHLIADVRPDERLRELVQRSKREPGEMRVVASVLLRTHGRCFRGRSGALARALQKWPMAGLRVTRGDGESCPTTTC
jgi:hypothetical protein